MLVKGFHFVWPPWQVPDGVLRQLTEALKMKWVHAAQKASMKNHSALFFLFFSFLFSSPPPLLYSPITSLACCFLNICYSLPCHNGRFTVYFGGSPLLFHPVVLPTSLHFIFAHIRFACMRSVVWCERQMDERFLLVRRVHMSLGVSHKVPSDLHTLYSQSFEICSAC